MPSRPYFPQGTAVGALKSQYLSVSKVDTFAYHLHNNEKKYHISSKYVLSIVGKVTKLPYLKCNSSVSFSITLLK